MNKNIKWLLLLLAIFGLVYAIIKLKPLDKLKAEKSDFSIQDTSVVGKIFIADTKNNKVLLTKNANGVWMLNQQEFADVNKINLLLQTLHDVRMRNPITSTEHNTIMKEFALAGIKCEVYDEEDDLIKTIYVGQNTLDQSGTYMMLEGSTTPFVAHIQGFIGYLTPRFEVNAIKWRSKLVFNFAATEIEKIEVSYPQEPDNSFVLDNSDKKSPKLFTLSNQFLPADTGYLKFYLASFKELYCEAYDNLLTTAQHDSIYKTEPYCLIKVGLANKTENVLKVHIKGLNRRTKSRYTEQGQAINFDTEQFYGFLNGNKNLMYIQYFNFGRVLKTAKDFVR